MPSIYRGRQNVFFLTDTITSCLLWTCPLGFGLAYRKSHSSLFSGVLCIYNYYICSISIKLSWASVNCQILKFTVVIQYLIWFFFPTSNSLIGWRLSSSPNFFCLKGKEKTEIVLSHNITREFDSCLDNKMIKRDFNPLLFSACCLRLQSYPAQNLYIEYQRKLLKDQIVVFDFLHFLRFLLVFQMCVYR